MHANTNVSRKVISPLEGDVCSANIKSTPLCLLVVTRQTYTLLAQSVYTSRELNGSPASAHNCSTNWHVVQGTPASCLFCSKRFLSLALGVVIFACTTFATFSSALEIVQLESCYFVLLSKLTLFCFIRGVVWYIKVRCRQWGNLCLIFEGGTHFTQTLLEVHLLPWTPHGDDSLYDCPGLSLPNSNLLSSTRSCASCAASG